MSQQAQTKDAWANLGVTVGSAALVVAVGLGHFTSASKVLVYVLLVQGALILAVVVGATSPAAWKGTRVLAVIRILAGTSVLIIAEVLDRSTQTSALAIATYGLGALILVHTIGTYYWVRGASGAGIQDAMDDSPQGPDTSQSQIAPKPRIALKPIAPAGGRRTTDEAAVLREAASLSISTQGIVLGLISFSDTQTMSTAAKVGAASLAAGVLTGSILYLLVAYGIPDQKRRVAAGSLFNITFWALGYGLLCVVASLWTS
jgi:hypothetical protein